MAATAAPGLWEGLAAHCRQVIAERVSATSNEVLMLALPVIFYWTVAGLYDILDRINHPAIARFRIHPKSEDGRNRLTKAHVIGRVLLQHALQTGLGVFVMFADPAMCDAHAGGGGWPRAAKEFVFGMLVLDTWQYFIHRCARALAQR